MKKPPFVENQIYHIYNRGVEKRDIFMDTADYMRFVYSLFVFNDIQSTHHVARQTQYSSHRLSEAGLRTTDRELLVEILVFCLMPNHFHLMLRQVVDGGIVKFMHKVGTAHAKYFNKRYDRVGPLCQGNFQAVLVEKDAHFLYLPHYIHINPLDLINARSPASDIERVRFLENYQWSSFPDYVGSRPESEKNLLFSISSVTQRNFLLETFGGKEGYREDIKEFLKTENSDFNQIGEILLD